MLTFWLVTWVVGAFLILGPCITGIGSNSALDEGVKVITITLTTLFWPLSLLWGCLMSWKQIVVGK